MRAAARRLPPAASWRAASRPRRHRRRWPWPCARGWRAARRCPGARASARRGGRGRRAARGHPGPAPPAAAAGDPPAAAARAPAPPRSDPPAPAPPPSRVPYVLGRTRRALPSPAGRRSIRLRLRRAIPCGGAGRAGWRRLVENGRRGRARGRGATRWRGVGASYPLAPRISTQSAPSDHPSSPAWQARRVARVNGVEHAQWMQMQCRLRQPHMRA